MSVSSLKLIKSASIIMGVLIILGIIALIFGLQRKFSEITDVFTEATISLNQGQIIHSVTTDAAGGVLLWIHQSEEPMQKQLIMHVDKQGTVKRKFYIMTK